MDDVGFIFIMIAMWLLVLVGLITAFSDNDPSPEEIRCTDAGGVWVQKHCLTEYKIPVKEPVK